MKNHYPFLTKSLLKRELKISSIAQLAKKLSRKTGFHHASLDGCIRFLVNQNFTPKEKRGIKWTRSPHINGKRTRKLTELGTFIKSYRMRYDLTQEKLANLIGLSSEHISDIETGVKELGESASEKMYWKLYHLENKLK